MSRFGLSTKTEADSLKNISIAFLKKHKYLQGGYVSGTCKWTSHWSGSETSVGLAVAIRDTNKYLRIYYTQTEMSGEKKEFDYEVPLTTTKCNYGGQRYWFICPLTVNGKYCGRRVGVLYKAGDYFGCRHCQKLTYKSRNRSRSRRSWYAAFNVLDMYEKVEEIESTMKRRYYAGKPTRKQRKVEKLRKQAIPDILRLSLSEKVGK